MVIFTLGSFINHVATKGEGGRKSPKIGNVIGVKLATLGGRGGPKLLKKWLHGL